MCSPRVLALGRAPSLTRFPFASAGPKVVPRLCCDRFAVALGLASVRVLAPFGDILPLAPPTGFLSSGSWHASASARVQRHVPVQ